MTDHKVFVDDTSPFRTYDGGARFEKHIARIRLLPRNWLGKRLMFAMRRMARKHIGDCVDMELFGAKMRLYQKGNASEKRALFAPQFYDLDDRLALAELAEDGAVFIDIGANIGLYSFSVARHFAAFKDTKIISIEPHPEIYRRLAFNRSLNPSLPIQLFQGGIGAKEDEVQLLTGEGNLGQTRILREDEAGHPESITVPIITLMALCEKFDLQRIDGMKIDVEGYEEAVLLPFLDNAPDTLLPRLIVIEDNQKEWETDLISAILNRGFKLHQKTKMNLLFTRV
ncbi:MAG: FkbM family methyltransferase [Parvibaculales bacterium]